MPFSVEGTLAWSVRRALAQSKSTATPDYTSRFGFWYLRKREVKKNTKLAELISHQSTWRSLNSIDNVWVCFLPNTLYVFYKLKAPVASVCLLNIGRTVWPYYWKRSSPFMMPTDTKLLQHDNGSERPFPSWHKCISFQMPIKGNSLGTPCSPVLQSDTSDRQAHQDNHLRKMWGSPELHFT